MSAMLYLGIDWHTFDPRPEEPRPSRELQWQCSFCGYTQASSAAAEHCIYCHESKKPCWIMATWEEEQP